MKRMLINATHTDEIRVAIADGQKLYDLDIDSAGHYRKKGNIYKAKITRVEPSLEACFVNYGSERHGFLPYKEISPSYFRQSPKGKGRVPINEAVKEGDEIIVQVNKEERGNKGAALSTYISLAGRYLVYMPGNHRAGGISRQIRGEKRNQLQEIMRRLEIPKNDGVIIRTAGLGRTFEELQWDFNYLKQVWEAIGTAAKQKKGPFFIYQESDLFIRALRDYLQPDIGEILIDDRESYEKAREFMQQVMPHNLKKLSYYNDNTPLFSRYQIERQIQSAFEREVKLPSGGALVIDQTEALLSIDINSAKATKGIDVETTALNTNLEAADEIARQLKIRDLGGLVVIDFIDMRNNKNQREVENRMRDAAESDRARVQIGKISKFGLLEMSRQRLRSSISDSSQVTCPTCGGHGYIRSMESLVISIIRLTEEEMIKPKTGRVVIQAPVDTTNKILNEKRNELSEMEARHGVQVSVISNDNLSFPDFHVQRLNTNESHISVDAIELVKPEDCHKPISIDPPAPTIETPALRMVKPDTQAPKRTMGMAISAWFKGIFTKPENESQRKQSRNKSHKKNPKQAAKGQQKQGHKPNQPKGQKSHPQKNQQKQGQKPNQQQGQPKEQQKGPQKNQNPNQQKGPQKGQQKGQKPAAKQNQQQQQNKPAPKSNQQQNQKAAQQKQAPNNQGKPQHNKAQQQSPSAAAKGGQNKDNNLSNKQNQKQNNNPDQDSNSNQNKSNHKGGKSIYGNKNQKQNTNKASNSETETDPNTVKKMTRPLGSVAELAAKKEPMVPSGAMKNRPIDNIDVDSKLNQKQAEQKQVTDKPANKDQGAQGSGADKNSSESNTENKPDNKPVENKPAQSQEQQTTKKKASKKKTAKKSTKKTPAKKVGAKKADKPNSAADKKDGSQSNEKPTEGQAKPKAKASKKTAQKKSADQPSSDVKRQDDSNAVDSKKSTDASPVKKKATKKKTATKKTAAKKKPVEAKSNEANKSDKNDTAKATDSATDKPKSSSSVTAEMIKPGLYKAKKSDD